MPVRSRSAASESSKLATVKLRTRVGGDIPHAAAAGAALFTLNQCTDQRVSLFLVAPNEIADVVARIGITAAFDAIFYPRLQRVWKGDIHRRHWRAPQSILADFGKVCQARTLL